MFLITGGGSGIGRALAHALAARGKDVLIIGRREQALAETAAVSSRIHFFCADVSTPQGRERIVAQLQHTPTLEGLIHNAGIIEPITPLTALDQSSWEKIMATNLHAPLFLTQALVDKLQHGRILHIGSGAAYFPVVGWSGYCVSKAGLAMLTRCWQLENPALSFTSVMPGIIDTAMQEVIRNAANMDQEKNNFFRVLQKEGKLLSTATVGLFLCWLLLDVEREHYIAKEWDIYDKSHHSFWLPSSHQVPDWE